MTVRNIIQLGLPVGSTLLIVAFIETNMLFYAFLRDFGVLIFNLFYEPDQEHVWNILVQIVVPIFKTFTTFGLLWIGVIFLGSRNALLGWGISMMICLAWFFIASIDLLATGGVYLVAAYVTVVYTSLFTYEILIGFWSYQELKREGILQPIGKGLVYIWNFFSNDLHAAAKFFLISEMTLDFLYIVSRQFIAHVFGIPSYFDVEIRHPAIVTEQLIMTCIRFLVDAIGLFCVLKEKRGFVRIWCIGAAIQILISTGLFVLLTVMWRGEDITYSFSVLIMFPVHLLFRSVVFYFCLRYTRINFSTMVLEEGNSH